LKDSRSPAIGQAQDSINTTHCTKTGLAPIQVEHLQQTSGWTTDPVVMPVELDDTAPHMATSSIVKLADASNVVSMP